MTYEQKFELVRTSLLNHCAECIRANWERMFDMWLSCEADMEFGYGYQNKFNEQFSQYIDTDINSSLWLSGKNIVFAIKAFISYKNNAKLEDVLDFTHKFVSEQLDDFNNWCEDISAAMYDEETPDNEDNPS